MYSKLKPALLVVPMAMLVVLFQQCSEVDFVGLNKEDQWSAECAQDSTKCKIVTENFNTQTSNREIDFMWIVDNSASMQEEVSAVQNNMAAFANKLGNYTDLKMALISAKNNATNPNGSNGPKYQSNPKYFTLPTMPSNVQSLQVNTMVRSRDALLVGGLSLCPSSGLAADSWCSKIQSDKKVFFSNDSVADRQIPQTEWNDRYAPALSQISNFVREQSHKVFVIVTDDDARAMDRSNENHVFSSQFLNAYNSRFPNSKPIVYAIASPYEPGAEPSGCEIWNKGAEYKKLSDATDGEFFDICASDWTPYFNKMFTNMTELANTRFPLKTVNVVEILSVKVNGTLLDPSDYSYSNRVLKIKASVMAGYATYDIEVEILEYVN